MKLKDWETWKFPSDSYAEFSYTQHDVLTVKEIYVWDDIANNDSTTVENETKTRKSANTSSRHHLHRQHLTS